MKKITFLTFLLLTFLQLGAQNVVINEIITSNSTVITDDDGSYEDWVELYNTGTEAINLEGYGLTDLSTNPYQWVFPAYWIEPGEHLLVWCSDKNRTDINFPLHTNFKISSGGEVITLTKPNGDVEDSYPAVLVPQNFTYGRQTDGSAIFVYFPVPTPGETNNTSTGYTDVLDPPSFSVNGGFYTSSFGLTISHPDPEVTIVYTTDGSDPNIDNLAGTTYQYKNEYPYEVGQLPSETFLTKSFQSMQYSAPLTIVDRTSEPNDISTISSTYDADPSYYIPDFNIFKGTVVRARAYKAGALTSGIVTESYFVSPEGSSRFEIPVISLSVDENKFFEYNNGIYVAGADFDNWRIENPDTPALFNADANYDRSGETTEQIGHFNYFVNGNEVLNQRVGIRINGGGTRAFQHKSLRLYARSELGASTFNYPIFANENYTSYKRLVLRNSGNDFFNTYYKDAFTHELIEKTGLDNQAYQPSVVFLNGEYWGMLNIRERLDRHYFERKYGIVEADIEILADGYVIDEGSDAHFQAMYSYFQNNSLVDDANLSYINTQMDVDNFRDYFITNIFIQNTDWPGWNTLFWRKKTAAFEPDAPYGNDGRWRTAIKDTDAGFSLMLDINDHNTLEFATALGGPIWPNPEWSTLILRRLLENEAFELSFINRFADMMNTFFLPERVVDLSNQFAAVIEPEIAEQYNRWAAPYSFAWWLESQNVVETFAMERPDYQREHIRAKFGISNDINATLNVNDDTNGYVKINTIDITSDTPGVSANPYPWTGIYFHNIPVTLTAIPLEGFAFSHWSGDVDSTDAEITYTPIGNFSVTANFIPAEVPATEEPIYFWMMDGSVTNDTPLTALNSSFEVGTEGVLNYQSCLVGYPFDNTHPNWRKASMERRNSPTDINYMPEANNNLPFATSNMRGLQIKQPFQNEGFENAMIFSFSTLGYEDIVFGFAAKDENAADGIVMDYSIDGSTFTNAGLANSNMPLTATYQLFETDFSAIATANNNANFKVRVRFSGDNLTADNGDRVTFNNFSVKGVEMPLSIPENTSLIFKVYPNPASEVLNINHSYSDVTFNLFTIDGKIIKAGNLENQQINISDLQSGIYLLQLSSDGKSETKKIVKK
ncbi:MAG TPA: CotH kinase family protein [Flavobacterium sp.]|uniref:CotH kinase family protein n=2 Tax=Flavobacterium TaxID=237 RepID=UPI0025BE5094|nr:MULTISPECIES: CotH kinase family protein [unclassified Flavobacterium]HRE78246.1 CotH kinase family protein [Flavobacterium sp.]